MAFVHFTPDGKIDVDLQFLHNVSKFSPKYSGSGSFVVHFVNSAVVPGHNHLCGSSPLADYPAMSFIFVWLSTRVPPKLI